MELKLRDVCLEIRKRYSTELEKRVPEEIEKLPQEYVKNYYSFIMSDYDITEIATMIPTLDPCLKDYSATYMVKNALKELGWIPVMCKSPINIDALKTSFSHIPLDSPIQFSKHLDLLDEIEKFGELPAFQLYQLKQYFVDKLHFWNYEPDAVEDASLFVRELDDIQDEYHLVIKDSPYAFRLYGRLKSQYVKLTLQEWVTALYYDIDEADESTTIESIVKEYPSYRSTFIKQFSVFELGTDFFDFCKLHTLFECESAELERQG